MMNAAQTKGADNMDIQKILTNAAKQDMRIARKSGAMGIYGTKQGVVELTYDAATKLYEIKAFHGGKHIAGGKAGQIVEALKGLYVIVEEGVTA